MTDELQASRLLALALTALDRGDPQAASELTAMAVQFMDRAVSARQAGPVAAANPAQEPGPLIGCGWGRWGQYSSASTIVMPLRHVRIGGENEDQRHAGEMVKKAISWPARQIAINAGDDGSVVAVAPDPDKGAGKKRQVP